MWTDKVRELEHELAEMTVKLQAQHPRMSITQIKDDDEKVPLYKVLRLVGVSKMPLSNCWRTLTTCTAAVC